GQVSSSLNFNVSAIDAYQDLVITAPAGFEVSLNENTGFAPSITITPVTNAIADTTVYTRVATGQTGRLSGNISLISGTVTANVAVIAENNNSLYFDGVDDYVTLAGNTFADGITAFTIEAWILPDNSNWDGAYHAIFGLQDNGSPNSRNPSFYILDGRIHIDSYEDVTNNRFDILTDEPLITQNVWSHIALVKQGNLFTVYVNGQAEFTTAAPNAVNIVGPYNIGFIDNYFAGKIDDIRFWDISRTASEIANNMNTALTGNETGLVDNYTFNEGVSEGSNTGLTALPDNSVSSNDGTLNNFALNGSSSNWVQGYFSQISGEDNVAIGGQTQLTHLESGGVWASDDTDFATVTQSGLVTGVALGTVEISYTLCGQITVKNIEVNNPPGFTVSETTLTIDENAGTDTFTVVLNGQPASDVVFDVSSDDTDEAIVSSPQLTFTMANWNTPQTITVTGVDDTEIGNDSAIITVALNAVNSDDAFDELSNQTVAVTLTNDGDNLPVFTNPSSDYDISTAIYISADRFRVFDQESQPFGLAFNNTGSKMYIIGRINSTIYEYALSNPYNQSSATLTTSFSVFNEETDPYEIVFNANGSKMFITGPGSDKIIEYNLSTPFDISSATHMASDDFDVKNETNFAIGLEFNNDGTKMFVLSLIGDQVLAYDLNVAYDVSTAVYANKTFYIGAEHDSPQGITFNNLGTKMFIIGNGNSSLGNQDDAIVEYSLGTPYDIDTAVYNGDDEELKVGAQDGQPTDVVFDSTGDYVYILGYNDDNVDRYAIQKQLQFEENSIMIVTDVDANDGDGGGTDIGITYSLLSGGDNDLFAIDGATGEISFISSPDFENPQDVNVDNNYIVTFTATDSDGSTSSEIIVIVNDVVETVSFNIDEISETNVDENATYTGVIPNITGTPIGTVSYTLSGNDAADFTIDSTTGVVSMVVRNFESPEDDDADNVYEVTITATDEDGNTDSEDWTVTVNNVSETASFTIDAIANANINENSSYTSVTPNITGSSIGNVTYILGGADAADFTINANSGVVSMVARDFENPEDDNTDNVYELSIIATDDDDNNDSENWTVTVDNLTETASFTIDAIANTNINENSSYTSTTPNITGSPIGNVTYTLGGSDAADFTIDSATGVVSMVVRNFESPEDDDTDNLYEVAITATDDDGNTDSEDWTVTIEDVSEITSFTINAIADDSIDEETPYTGPVPSITGTPVGIITYSLGGADAAIFSLDNDTGQVFMPSRSFENPDDVNGDNGYEVSITATDEDGNNATEAWTITLIDIVEVSNFTINTIFDLNVEENAVYTSVIPTLSGEAPIGHITYTLSGVDATSFTVNSITGVVSMVLRDFENPADNNTDNVYEVTITATDQDANTDNEDWTVTIDNVTETLSFTIDNIIDTEVNENVSYTSATPSITGNPVGNITYSLNGTDASDFTINTATGVVRMVARNFENPEDNNADNVYEVSITVTDDDGNTDGEDWTVTINNITEEDVDTDGDGIPDDADDFPNDPDEDTDTDGDGTGDNEDDDDDGDGTLDDEDAFPKNPDEDTDTDGDGIGDNEDEENNLDRDGDGVPDSEDAFPDDSEESVDQDGDGVGANKDLDDNNRNIREEQLVISAEAFTPNGDGINDTWIIQGIQNYPNALVTVYNRYGHEVFKAIGYQNDWSGRSSSSSENLPAGSYYYVINLGNGATPVDGWIFINY
ncbi:MAG: cadherin domain-containing protein, partial [Maribacter sp.]